MKPRTKRLMNLLLILVPLAIVLVIGFSDNGLPEAWQAVRSMNLKWVLYAILCYCGYLCMDSISIGFFLFRQGFRVKLRDLFFISVAGQYYSNITPGASGGQPMQIYYLSQKKVTPGVATSAIAVRFFCFQAMLSVIGTVLWIRYGAFIQEHTAGSKWIFVVGYIYNTLMVAAVALLALSKNVIKRLINWGIRVGAKFHWIRKPEDVQKKLDHQVNTFHDSLTALKNHPMDLVIQLLIGGAQLLFLMSVIHMVYRGLGLTGTSYGQLVTMNVCEFIAAAYMPMPGASGAQEGVFSLYFNQIFPDSLIFPALLLWRFFTYYIAILMGVIAVTVHGVREGNSLREASRERGHMLDQVMQEENNL